VQDLLSLARIEASEGTLRLAQVDIVPIVRAVVSRREGDTLRKQQQIHVELAAEHLRVMGEQEALTQILDNLVDNAIKYTPQSGELWIRTRANENHVFIEVEDTGIGIPESDLDRVFERFYRVDKGRSRQVGGTGLGLSIVKHLVGAMHGKVEVRSAVGK